MIKDVDLAHRMAVSMAAHVIFSASRARSFAEDLLEQDENSFSQVMHYRFHGEALYIHLEARRVEQGQPPTAWDERPEDYRLAMNIYCQIVPLLSPHIAPPETAPADPKPATPGRGFETIAGPDDMNEGTIHERENFGAAQRAQPLPQAEAATAADAGRGAADSNEDDPASLSEGGTDAGMPMGREVVSATVADEPAITLNDIPGEGGDVIDDDDVEGGEGGDVEGDDDTPPVAMSQPKRKRR